ncbi:peroxiredoxin family protein [Marinithermus hydrothermalis]|uniref:Redoxin domain protein n=1 Tax=Marinithermus hydrothermalis (strain DSM 14884 / JCM 11576 / T1) TaxID=869210 RepID=F2NN06_MARHT|nr:TlpA disulfide reductase family protein [Marinithermus hydrothermalis]AEB12745.1 Redoxin domain protein [Marinithermus hydrothermalis DSM 14884]
MRSLTPQDLQGYTYTLRPERLILNKIRGLLYALLLLSVIGWSTSAFAQQPTIPGIAGEAADLDLSRYTGQIVVVTFIAGICPSCWAEIPGFLEVYRDLKERGVAFVGIAVQTPKEDTKRMIQRLGITYPVYLDESGRVSIERFGLRGMPTTMIFDANGRLVQRFVGKVSAKTLRRLLEEML